MDKKIGGKLRLIAYGSLSVAFFILGCVSFAHVILGRTNAADEKIVTIRTNDASTGTISVSPGNGYTVDDSDPDAIVITYTDNSATPQISATAASGYIFDKFISTRSTSTMSSNSDTTTFTSTMDDNIVAMFAPTNSDATRGIRRLYYSNAGNPSVRIVEPGCSNAASDDSCIKAGEYILSSTPTGATAIDVSGNLLFRGWYTTPTPSKSATPLSTSLTFDPSSNPGNSYHCGNATCDNNGQWGESDSSFTYYAVFDAVTTYTVSSNNSALGEVTIGYNCDNASGISGAVNHIAGEFKTDNNKPILACATSGSSFGHWELDGVEISGLNTQIQYNNASFPDDGQAHTLVAVFATTSYTISSDDTTLGQVTIGSDCINASGISGSVMHSAGSFGTNYQAITACPSGSNTFSHWELDGIEISGLGAQIQYNDSHFPDDLQSHTLVAVFDAAVVPVSTPYTISTADASLGGIKVGYDCNNASTSNISLSYVSGEFNTSNHEPIRACPSGSNTFSHWELDGETYSTNQIINYNATNLFSDGEQHTLSAVFAAAAPTTTTYTVGPNNQSLGGTNIGSDCTGASSSDRTLTYTSGEFNTNGESIRACPSGDNTFVRWELDGHEYSTSQAISYNASGLSSDGGTHTLRAVFAAPASPATYTVSTSDSALGLINIGSDCTGANITSQSLTYSSGEFNTNSDSIWACPVGDNQFLRWELDGVQYSNTSEIVHNANFAEDGATHTLRAVFMPDSSNGYTVNVGPGNPSYGSISVASGTGYTVSAGNSGSYNLITSTSGSVTTGIITLNPTAACDSYGGAIIDCVFVGFTSINGTTTWTKGANKNEYILTLNGEDKVTAEFVRETQYKFDSHDTDKGGYDLIDGSCSSENISIGSDYTKVKETTIGPVLDTITEIVACPYEGNEFSYWELDGIPISTNPVLSNADKHIIDNHLMHNIMAVFTNNATNYAVTIMPDDASHGSISIANGSGYSTWSSNGEVHIQTNTTGTVTTGTVTVTPSSGYVFDHFSSGTGNTTWAETAPNEYTFTLTGYDTVIAYFRSSSIAVQYTIGPNVANYGGVNTTQNSCSDETSRLDIFAGLDASDYLDVPAANIIACPNTNFAFDHWELDGVTISSSATLSKSGYQWPTTGSHDLRAVFVLRGSQQAALPATGSVAMWLILGGAIALVGIPSALLIIGDRKDQRKKGDKT